MTTDIDQELRAAFRSASEFVQPAPGLAHRARRRRRQRRYRLLAATAAVVAVLAAATAATYAVVGGRQPASQHGKPRSVVRIQLPLTWQVRNLAVSGRYLYVLAGSSGPPPYTLRAYDSATGRLIRQIAIPAEPSALAVGPGGLVWVAFYPNEFGGPTAIWLLSPDLAARSAGPKIVTSIILPTSRLTALIPDQYGLVAVRLPVPGRPGKAGARPEPGTSLGPSANTAPGVGAAMLRGRVVVQVTNGYGNHSHLVVAGDPSVTFGGGPQTQAGSLTSEAGWLWLTTGGSSGPLVRLDGQLRPATPEPIRRSRVLAQAEHVWSHGHTVWVATAAAGHALVCFAAGNRVGPVATVLANGQVTALAATSGVVYLSLAPPGEAAATVTSYPVPAACR